jgi:hypothetical protein
VVFLDQHGVIQADAVVGAAAGAHRVFLRQAQAGQGFARVHNVGAVAGNTLHGITVSGGLGGHGAEQLQKIERGTLGGEQASCRALHLQHHLVGDAALALWHQPLQAHVGVKLHERGLCPRRTADGGGFTRQNARLGRPRRINQPSRQIAATHIFLQGPRNVGLGQGRDGGLGKIEIGSHQSRIFLNTWCFFTFMQAARKRLDRRYRLTPIRLSAHAP